MGIRGLKTYVDNLPPGDGHVWESFDLRDTNLVIDGCGFNFYIYESNKLNCKFGGQYDEFKNKVKEFIKKLREKKVEPYVVFDGIAERDEKKSVTYEQSKSEKIEKIKRLWASRNPDYEIVLPPLTKLAIMQVLQEMKVNYAVADFEADCEIASLANELDAPVLANDSDFYIFNIKNGYIPFKEYKLSGSKTTVRKFSFSAFAKHLGINPEMLPLLASLVGNDYISDIMLRPFHIHIDDLIRISTLDARGSKKSKKKTKNLEVGKKCRVSTIAEFVSKRKSDSEAIDAVIDLFPKDKKASFKNALDLSIKEYQMKQSNLIGYFVSGDLSCNMLTYNGHPLPQWVVKLYRQGLIASEGLDCLCNRKIFPGMQSEDIESPSAQICAQGLRWYYYKLVLNCEGTTNTDSTSRATTEDIVVTEFDREKSERVANKVNLTREIPEMNVQIHDILRMSDEDRKTHILGLLDSDLPSIHDLPPEHQMVAAAMRYWLIHSQITPAHLAALLVYYVDYEKRSLSLPNSAEISSKQFHGSAEISSKQFHGFAQWQNVLHWAEWLNRLFPRTFPQLQVARLYRGLRVCKLYERLQDSKGDTSAESDVTNKGDYNLLFNAITKELPPDRQFNQSPSRKRQNEKDITSKNEKKRKS